MFEDCTEDDDGEYDHFEAQARGDEVILRMV
jgi:hypothetical protein